MKKRRLICFLTVIGVAVAFQPAVVADDMVFFDPNGAVIEKAQYEQYVSEREKALKMDLRNGYTPPPVAAKDPIKLRKKRIEQWEKMRSGYHPDSLPAKIEKPPVKTN